MQKKNENRDRLSLFTKDFPYRRAELQCSLDYLVKKAMALYDQ